ncbi:SRPBCC family protein [Halopiger goleimassiliensis]|uniref:SRPBCC family protein n=1 Tax=Halopiger goleimassiliensis TaxID=1293048 RepID=UPI00067772CA|nr:SRPBCC family protein [Halopiger goleimassiliensis]
MASYDRRTTVDAPLEEVWAFHSSPAGLERLTPDWMNLLVEAAVGPDGERDPAVLEAGSELSLSVRPFGIGPRQYVRSAITERERAGGRAYFRDELVDGPFDRWEHTHAFFADGDRTIVRDHVVYDLPYGSLGRFATPLSTVGFEATFRDRHRRTKAALE